MDGSFIKTYKFNFLLADGPREQDSCPFRFEVKVWPVSPACLAAASLSLCFRDCFFREHALPERVDALKALSQDADAIKKLVLLFIYFSLYSIYIHSISFLLLLRL